MDRIIICLPTLASMRREKVGTSSGGLRTCLVRGRLVISFALAESVFDGCCPRGNGLARPAPALLRWPS